MSGTLLVPVHVDARVITPSPDGHLNTAPKLKDDASVITLATGVHVHWALPDALTGARTVKGQGKPQLVIPAVPDLWLVVRFNPIQQKGSSLPLPTGAAAAPAMSMGNPGPLPVPGGIKVSGRPSRAWVVESRGARKVDFGKWTAPTDYRQDQVLTALGLCAAADALGEPGWGIPPADGAGVNLHAAAYYPECQNVFGLHDDLSDLPRDAAGTVTYSVIGWYRFASQDPMLQASDPTKLREQWKLLIEGDRESRPAVRPMVSTLGENPNELPVIAATLPISAERAERLRTTAPVPPAARGATRPERLALLTQSFGGLAPVNGTVDLGTGIPPLLGPDPDQLVCHGAVLGVNLAGGNIPVPQQASLLVVPSLQQALAEVAYCGTDPDKKLVVQAMILDADKQIRRVAEDPEHTGDDRRYDPAVAALLNELHALGFQGKPGHSSYFAHIEIAPPKNPKRPAWAKELVPPKVASGPSLSSRPSWMGFRPTADVGNWTTTVANALSALGSPHPVDSKIVRVTDHRPPSGHLPGMPKGPHGGSYWVDLGDPKAMWMFLLAVAGAPVWIESVQEVTGPRWYRPWSPHVILEGIGRPYRHGFDGRFDDRATSGGQFDVGGRLSCRRAGDTISSLNLSLAGFAATLPVTGEELLGGANWLPGLPGYVRSLLGETLLLDRSNVAEMGRLWLAHFGHDYAKAPQPKLADVVKELDNQVSAMRLLRDPKFAADWLANHDLPQYESPYWPSPIAFTPWEAQPWSPLFAKFEYTFNPRPVGALDQVDVGLVEIPADDASKAIAGSETQLLTPSLAYLLERALVSNQVAMDKGTPAYVNAPDPNNKVTSETLLSADVLSAALTGFDDNLPETVARRAGYLQIAKATVVDSFGSTFPFPKPAPTWRTALKPRLRDWARLQVRLLAADDPGHPAKDATFASSPICGFVLPDLVEHALEIYDGSGKPLGQIFHGAQNAMQFAPHPLHPTGLIQNPQLKAFVDGVLKSKDTSPPDPKVGVPESSLTALLRVIDSLRASVAPDDRHGEHRLRMLGAPIALVRTGVWLERGIGDDPDDQSPSKEEDPVQLQFKMGAFAQLDDGVLGCFLPATNPAGDNAHFRPTAEDAVKSALLNGMTGRDPSAVQSTEDIKNQEITNSFVRDPEGADTTFTLLDPERKELLVFLDIKGAMYVTSGLLPRKRITLPRELLDGALKNLAPSLSVGPVLAFPDGDKSNPFLPAPSVEGFTCQWIEEGAHAAEPLPPTPPDGVTPPARCSVTEGWFSFVANN